MVVFENGHGVYDDDNGDSDHDDNDEANENEMFNSLKDFLEILQMLQALPRTVL